MLYWLCLFLAPNIETAYKHWLPIYPPSVDGLKLYVVACFVEAVSTRVDIQTMTTTEWKIVCTDNKKDPVPISVGKTVIGRGHLLQVSAVSRLSLISDLRPIGKKESEMLYKVGNWKIE